ncbi:MAG TPA: hypothetical protein VGL27_14890 [Negativicutes bacterium]
MYKGHVHDRVAVAKVKTELYYLQKPLNSNVSQPDMMKKDSIGNKLS